MLNNYKKIVVDDSILNVNAVDLWDNTVCEILSNTADKMVKEDEMFYHFAYKIINSIPTLLNQGEYDEAVEEILPFLKVIQAESYFKKHPHFDPDLKKDVSSVVQQLVNFISVCKTDQPPTPVEKIPKKIWKEKDLL